MILSNVEVQRAIDEGRLIISPEPLPRAPAVGQHCPYDTHSVDLRLANEIIVPERDKFVYDPAQPGNIAGLIQKNSESFTLSASQPYVLEPSKFVLGRTIEHITLPIIPGRDTCLAARIEGKSGTARLALLVHFTAPTVHPGFDGTLTLEMINLGPASILLKPGMYIAQLIVEEVMGIPNQNPSQFQGQNTAAGLATATATNGNGNGRR